MRHDRIRLLEMLDQSHYVLFNRAHILAFLLLERGYDVSLDLSCGSFLFLLQGLDITLEFIGNFFLIHSYLRDLLDVRNSIAVQVNQEIRLHFLKPLLQTDHHRFKSGYIGLVLLNIALILLNIVLVLFWTRRKLQ